jgi:hypothetical protein
VRELDWYLTPVDVGGRSKTIQKHGVCEIIFGLEPGHAAALMKNDPRFKP